MTTLTSTCSAEPTAAPTSVFDRSTRYAAVVPVERLRDTPVLIAGCGSIGRCVATMLASMGAERITLVDFDQVDGSNLGTQGYREKDLGIAKVDALANAIEDLAPRCKVLCHEEEYRPEQTEPFGVVFVCVDDMDARRKIMESELEGTTKLLIESRNGAETTQVRCVWDHETLAEWMKDWFPPSEAEPLPCSARSTLHGSYFSASLMISCYIRWLRDFDVPLLVEGSIGNPTISTKYIEKPIVSVEL